MMRTIMFLQDHDDLTVGDLAEALGISAGRASRIADQFERLGVVSRARDPHDRRVVRLRKTPESRAITERRTVRARAVVRLIAEFSPEQRRAIAEFLQRVAEEFERLRAEEEGPDPTGELGLSID
jgi:DNA-binding MarR family transcriptional regulator